MMKRIVCICFIIFLFSFLAACKPSQTQKEQPWQWSLEQIESKVNRVRAGKNLNPSSWPGGKRVAIALSFDVDAETSFLRDNQTSPGLLSQGEYAARVAVPRILALLDKYNLSATFFVPTVTAMLHQPEMQAIIAKGRHEIGIHGWIHERNSLLEETEERELMKKSYETLKKITGKAPVGIRTPSWDFSPSTLKIIKELGLLYDSSLMADERPYEILENGQPSGVIELPVEWLADDYPYFGFDRYSSVRPQITPMDVFSIWAAEFEKAYEEGTLFVLTMHPKYSGHRSRIMMLEKLIQQMLTFKDVWFATHQDVALYVKSGLQK